MVRAVVLRAFVVLTYAYVYFYLVRKIIPSKVTTIEEMPNFAPRERIHEQEIMSLSELMEYIDGNTNPKVLICWQIGRSTLEGTPIFDSQVFAVASRPFQKDGEWKMAIKGRSGKRIIPLSKYAIVPNPQGVYENSQWLQKLS